MSSRHPIGATTLNAAQALAAAVVLTRLARGRHRADPLGPGAPRPTEPVSVLIPARNEEQRLGPCLAAITRDPDVAEVIVIDDESEDRTAAVAADHGVRVLTGSAPPAGWTGKPWALQQGLEAARGPWVITLDADTRPVPGLAAAATAAAAEHGYDLLSLAGRYECDGTLEQALHAAMLATLVYRFGPPGTSHRPSAARTIANGQCLVLRKDSLLAVGGFGAAAPHLTDDVALARHLARVGQRVGMLDASALLSVDMHDGVRSVWREWGRSLPMADVTTPGWAAADVATHWLATALPLIRLLACRTTRLDRVLLAIRMLLLGALRGAYHPPRLGLLLSPLADPLVAAQLVAGGIRPARSWRGRTYPVTRPVLRQPPDRS